MKKYIIIAIVVLIVMQISTVLIVSAAVDGIGPRAEVKNIFLEGNQMGDNVRRFTDGPVVCYALQTEQGSGISCLTLPSKTMATLIQPGTASN